MLFIVILFLIFGYVNSQAMEQTMIDNETIATTIERILEANSNVGKDKIEKGVRQAASFWTYEDGTKEDFINFCVNNYIADEKKLLETFNRIQENLEIIFGNYNEINRELSKAIQLDIGPNLPIDYMFAEFSPETHLYEDLFKTKIAFVILLNFPIYSLEEKIELAPNWTRLDWAKARLADLFISRVPSEAQQKALKAYVSADDYISNYNIYMNTIIYKGKRNLFPEGLKLITHWGLRDELKAQYNNADGLIRQEAIFKIMEYIINQDIPTAVINNDSVVWDLTENKVYSRKDKKEIPYTKEENRRYQYLLDIFKAEKELDKYYPTLPTLIDRRFKRMREIPEEQVRKLLESILKAPVVYKIAKKIEKKLRRKLLPFDIWYSGFKPKMNYREEELDKILSEKYPNREAFQNDLINILIKLGFSKDKALFLSSKIEVDSSRGAGHALGARMRQDKAHLRTRIPKDGMKYKSFNIAMHELGHNVEQVFSLNEIDYYLLSGVPNTAFTEAFAFLFQNRDLEILGLQQKRDEDKYLEALDTMWGTYEIAGVALLDIEVWHWMYEHPNANKEELKKAIIEIAKKIWNEYYSPVFKIKDQDILAIYSHMIDYGLYLPDYPLGHIISFQISKYIEKKGDLAKEMERMCKLGTLLPNEWMKQAVGEEISAIPLIKSAEEALIHTP